MHTFTLATPQQRLIAGAIDIIVYSILAAVLGGAFGLFGLPMLGGVVATAYLLFRDSLSFLNYQSVGKKVTNTKVHKEGADNSDFVTDLKRNFLFIPSLISAFGINIYISGAITLVLTIIEIYLIFEKENHQRLGDRLGETLVIQL